MDLCHTIREKIKKEGAMSFRDYMELCLYHPVSGYYTSEKEKLGLKGDFFTSCHVSSSFGAMIAKQLEEFWEILGKKDFTVLEYGAGTGLLCADILTHLQTNSELYKRLRYCIIEKSPYMVKISQARLKNVAQWYEDIEAIEGNIDCVLSNELLDNFPVHQVKMKNVLQEIVIDYDTGFCEIERPAREDLCNYFKELDIQLPLDYRTEINLDALSWLEGISKKMDRGFILTIDYGAISGELYSNRRSKGTLLCYYQHQVNERLYEMMGRQDITAHVNFTALHHWGNKFGLQTCGLTNQALFLLSLGFKAHLRHTIEASYANLLQAVRAEAFACKTLLLEMGEKYKVMIQSKNVEVPKLTGLIHPLKL